jgi:superfamily II DNA or RNA helicase
MLRFILSFFLRRKIRLVVIDEAHRTTTRDISTLKQSPKQGLQRDKA